MVEYLVTMGAKAGKVKDNKMKKEVFNQIIQDNINSKLISVTLTGGMKLGEALEIEGNRTMRTSVSFIKLEENYVAVRKHTDVSYDYSGQTRTGDARNADFYLGYEEIIALEFFDLFFDEMEKEQKKNAAKQKEKEYQAHKKQIEKERKRKEKEEKLFIETAGDI